MKKLALTYCLLVILCSIGLGQSFELSEYEIHIDGSVGEKIEIPLSIKNLSEKPVTIVIEQLENNIGNSQKSVFCWGGDCLGDTPLTKRIDSKKNTNQLLASLETGLVEGYSSVKYLVYDKNNPQDAVDLVIHYNINEPVLKKTVYDSDQIQIKEVYPNPVNDALFVDYQVGAYDISAKISIHNVLGSVVNEFKLEPMELRAKINTTQLNPGVYFYSLSVDNETVLIKKFVVRR